MNCSDLKSAKKLKKIDKELMSVACHPKRSGVLNHFTSGTYFGRRY